MPDDRPAARSRAARALSLAVVLGIVGFLGLTVATQWSDLRDADVRFAPGWFAMAFAALLAYQALQGEVAGLVLRELGHPVASGRIRSIFGAGLLARYVPSGALTFVVRIRMESAEGVPRRVATLGLLYEFAVAFAGAAVVCALLLTRVSVGLAVAALVLSPVVVGTALHPRLFDRVTAFVLRRLGRDPLQATVGVRAVLGLTALCGLSFLCNGLAILLVIIGITDLPEGATPTVLAAAGLGFITGMLGFALPGGLGAREAGVTGALVLVVGALALPVAVVVRLLQTAAELLYAALVTVEDRRRGVGRATDPA